MLFRQANGKLPTFREVYICIFKVYHDKEGSKTTLGMRISSNGIQTFIAHVLVQKLRSWPTEDSAYRIFTHTNSPQWTEI